MKKTIKVYRWENGKMLEKEILKNDLKWELGWRTEPDEAMFFQLDAKRRGLENTIFEMNKYIDYLLELEDTIQNLKIKHPSIPRENNHGLSKESIRGLIDKLGQLLNANK